MTLFSFYTDQISCITYYCREEYVEEIRSARFQDPPTIKQKGCPRSQGLTGALEGHVQGLGGGGSIL